MGHLGDFGPSPATYLGATVLRLVLAGFWISHWWFKIGCRGMPATIAFFAQQRLPAWLAWFIVYFETVVAVCLILGIWVSSVCVASLPILFASVWIYRKNGFYFANGGVEFPLLWACAQVVQTLLGPGSFRITIQTWLP